MSELKVNKVSPRSGTAFTLGDSGDTFTVPTGASFVATDELKTNKISPSSGTAFTFGDSGDTFTVPSGATITNNGTASGFGGITMADQWRLTTSFTGDAGPISSNLERNDSSGYGSIGSAMTESSGTFTFPITGIYKLDYFLQIQRNAADDNQIFGEIFVVTDGSVNYSSVAHALYGSNYANQRLTVSTSYYFDVTNTSTHKVRFSVSSNSGNNTVVGASTHNATFFNFIRLGDT